MRKIEMACITGKAKTGIGANRLLAVLSGQPEKNKTRSRVLFGACSGQGCQDNLHATIKGATIAGVIR
ncbi:MAG: hypothetical protein QNL87_09790, partial [Gammaproteobacteria bacterium]|nr:hypothetical protein [Gammaproteobacteria bacterium]